MLMKQNKDVSDFDSCDDSRLTFVLHIAELVSGEQQVPGLLDAEAIVLEHLAREDDMLYKHQKISCQLSIDNTIGWVTKR